MTLIIGLLTFVLVVDSILLILLILMQLPKKEAGAGVAFGGSMADAVLGAGSGNFLTKLTKYAASIFIGLAIVLTVLNSQHAKRSHTELERLLSEQKGVLPGVASTKTTNPAPAPIINLQPQSGSNLLMTPTPEQIHPTVTNVLPKTGAATNAAPVQKK